MPRFLILLITLLLVSCATERASELYIPRELDEIYDSAVNLLEDEEYDLAANEFLNIEKEYPYSIWSEKAIVMAGFALYQGGKYENSIAQHNRYLQLYPNGEYTAYVNYLIGVSYYLQIANLGRDQQNAQKALNQFNLILERYSETDYASDARLKKDLAMDQIAGEEMEIGRFYLKKNYFSAAINRFKNVISNYQTTSHIEEALARYAEAYMSMGIYSEAQTAAAILGYNYPNSDWYEYTYNQLIMGGIEPQEDTNSWVSKAWKSIS
jgi:outer membrane protein assembly factor BamD